MKVVFALVVAGAAVVGAIVLLGGDGSTVTTNPSGGGTAVAPETPDLTFTTSKPVVETVTLAQRPKGLADAATTASKRAVAVLDTVYTETFLDPSSWEDGSYDDAWSQFTDAAAERAEADTAAMTAGEEAGGLYGTIEPVKATARPRVLVDDAGRPVSVVALVTFTAKGVHDDGSYTLFKSTGQWFLRPQGNAWKVVAFDVRRADSEREAPASPDPSSSGDPSPSESAS